MRGNYALVSGAIFGIVALLQALRAFNQWAVQIGSLDVPVWVSWAATVVAGGLCAWAFQSRRSEPDHVRGLTRRNAVNSARS